VGRKEKMNKILYGVAALAVASVVFSAGLVVADDNADEEETGAGGGGWFTYEGAKDTFGFHLNSSDWSMSEFVLQARDAGVKVKAYQFDNIAFEYDSDLGTGSADASGRAWIGGDDATFQLHVEDNGDRSLDCLVLTVTTDVIHTWDISSLGGGQIWVYLV